MCVRPWISPSFPLRSRPRSFWDTGRHARGVHFRGSALCRYMRAISLILLSRPLRGLSIRERASCQLRSCGHFRGSCLCRYMETPSPPPLRSSLRGSLRPSFRLSLRGPVGPHARQRPLQRRLRAWCFADIPTPPPGQNIESVAAVFIALSISSASLAPDSCATATALAPQRFSTASATVIASALPTQRLVGSALASQRFAAARSRAWGPA